MLDDTNIMITVSTRDKGILRFANALNEQLISLRVLRHKYARGDRELKEAVTNVSHDLRTPLTAICGYAELLQEKVQLSYPGQCGSCRPILTDRLPPQRI